MTDTPDTTATQPPIVVNAQYIRDLSFEAPNTPDVFLKLQQEQPDIAVNVDVAAKPKGGNLYEVALHLRAECKVGETVAFLLELEYGGLFSLNMAREHVQPVLLVECPRLLFPFARQITADATRDGGFPPLMLSPMDFAGMYQRRMQEMAAEANVESQGDVVN